MRIGNHFFHYSSIELHQSFRISGFWQRKPDIMNISSRWSIRLPTFFLSEVWHIPSPASGSQWIRRRCAAVRRVYRTDRSSSLIRAWPLWLAGPEREAAWRYNTVSSELELVHSAVAHQRSCFIVVSEQLWEGIQRGRGSLPCEWKFKVPLHSKMLTLNLHVYLRAVFVTSQVVYSQSWSGMQVTEVWWGHLKHLVHIHWK